VTVESLKVWRNRDSSVGESVLALLQALRDGLGAQSVGLFDDDRADLDAGSPRGALNFWNAFDECCCAVVDWEGWYRDLREHGRAATTCGCGEAHHLCGFLIHGRWALLLVAPPALLSTGAAAIASSLRALADKLPPARAASEREAIARYDDDPHRRSAATDNPVWWVRKLPQ
jgi:hypothetical protein